MIFLSIGNSFQEVFQKENMLLMIGHLVFNKSTIQALKTNYSPIEKIKIIHNSTTNTFNTFNTFWKGVERNGHYKDSLKRIEIAKDTERSEIGEETEISTASTSITVNATALSKEEEDVEHPTETNKISIL